MQRGDSCEHVDQALSDCQRSLTRLRSLVRKGRISRRRSALLIAKVMDCRNTLNSLADQITPSPSGRLSAEERAKAAIKQLGDRLLAENRPPTPQEMAEFQHQKTLID